MNPTTTKAVTCVLAASSVLFCGTAAVAAPLQDDADSVEACADMGWHHSHTKRSQHIIAKHDRFSSYLKPGQSVKYETSKTNQYSATVTAGTQVEAGAIIARATVNLDISVAATWSHSAGRTVTEKNTTSKPYRARLGNQGWKITESNVLRRP